MRIPQHDCVNIIAPVIENELLIESLCSELEGNFFSKLTSDLIYTDFFGKSVIQNRIQYIKEKISNNSGFSITDIENKVYLSLKNIELKSIGSKFCKISVCVNRSIEQETQQWMHLILSICEKSSAYWGLFSPRNNQDKLAKIYQRNRFVSNNKSEPWHEDTVKLINDLLNQYQDLNSLPNLDISGYYYKVDDINIVPEVRWINYWSSNICKSNNFLNTQKRLICDMQILVQDTGSCIWALTQNPFDITKSSDRKCLISAYEVFENVGIRV